MESGENSASQGDTRGTEQASGNASPGPSPVQTPPPETRRGIGETHQPKSGNSKSRKGCIIAGIVCGIVFAVGFSVILIITAILYLVGSGIENISTIQPSAYHALSKYREEVISGSMLSSEKILILDIRGVITGGYDRFYEVANSDMICDMLEQARKDNSVKAIVLRLDTPGGEVVASDMIRQKIKELQSQGITVVSSMGSVAASGGYWIAAGSDYIIANRLTITGSIGVIMQGFNYHDLLGKIGVFTETYKSGPMKDLGDPSRIRTEAEKKIIQDLIAETYGEFVKVVAEGRAQKGITEEKIRSTEIGDGRIFSGKQAFELGLVDELGYFEDAISKAAELAGTTDYKVIYYSRRFSFFDIFNTEAKAGATEINIDSLWKKNWKAMLEPGKLYLLPQY